ncbi:hypothetical protein BJV82DRAFT_591313 [Fennellomyces sp. T-0311]|nr:hypothetical protein BJV82DRAFT_591313 [Fennellomyces sp. T-0311]
MHGSSQSNDDIQSAADLESRVHFWASKGELNYELNDALLAIEHNPEHINNYLLTGVLYSMQGNYADANRVLEQGIAMIIPTDPLYTLFSEWNDKAKIRMHLHTDIIAQIPYEILAEIARYLKRKDLRVCFQVCRLWRSKWIEIPDPWKSIRWTSCYSDEDSFVEGSSVEGSSDEDSSDEGSSFEDPTVGVLSLISRHVEDVSLNMEPALSVKHLGLMHALEFSKLNSLSVFCRWHKGDNNPKPDILIKTMYDTLSHIGERLTTLKLNICDWKNSELSLEQILSNCPNLNTLRCICDILVDPYFGAWMTSDTQLTYLYLAPKRLQTSLVETLLRRSPHLKELILPKCQGQSILSILKDNCFNLKMLRLNNAIDDVESFFDLNGRSEEDQDRSSFLYVYVEHIESDEHLLPFIERHDANTLRSLVLNNHGPSTLENWRQLSTLAAPNLRALHLWIYEGSPIRSLFSTVLERHPGLTDLCLVLGYHNRVSDIPFSAIDYMGNLTTLSLRNIDFQGLAFVRLLQNCAAQGQNSQLSQLEIIGETCTNTSILRVIASIVSLTYLGLIFNVEAEYEEEDIFTFAEHIGDLPKLLKLELEGLEVTEEAAQHIVRCKTLQFIHCLEFDDVTFDILTSNIPTVSHMFGVYDQSGNYFQQ